MGSLKLNFDKKENKNHSLSASITIAAFSVEEDEKDNYRKITEKRLRILLIKRNLEPFIGEWALPEHFIDFKISMEDSAKQCLYEKTGFSSSYLEQLYTFGETDRDPRGRIISTAYLALLDKSRQDNPFNKTGKTEKKSWFNLRYELLHSRESLSSNHPILLSTYELALNNESENITAIIEVQKTFINKALKQKIKIIHSDGIAFDHAEIIAYAIQRLRNKAEYSPIVFSLMPDTFTLTELQQVYEIILGKELFKANFRRKIYDMVTETPEYKKDAGHRPSKLFRFNPKILEKL